jgi:hypothetical protein
MIENQLKNQCTVHIYRLLYYPDKRLHALQKNIEMLVNFSQNRYSFHAKRKGWGHNFSLSISWKGAKMNLPRS